MNRNPAKRKALIFLGVAFAALLLLAAGISQISFSGVAPLTLRPFVFEDAGYAERPVQGMQIIFYLFMALYLLAVVSIFLSREGRVRLIAFILMLGVVSLCLYAVGSLMEDEEPQVAAAVTGTPEVLPLDPEAQPTMELIPVEDLPLPQTPGWLVTVVGVTLAALLAGAVLGLLWFILRRRPSYTLSDVLAEEAQATVDELEAGGDLKNAIINCYARMSKAVIEAQGMVRPSAMTPREFGQVLKRVRFPAEPVNTLTHLFEEARYGEILPDAERVEQALTSLRAIVAHCEMLKAARKDMS